MPIHDEFKCPECGVVVQPVLSDEQLPPYAAEGSYTAHCPNCGKQFSEVDIEELLEE